MSIGISGGIAGHITTPTEDDNELASDGAAVPVAGSTGIDVGDTSKHRRNAPQLARHLRFVATATTPGSGSTTTVVNLGQPKVGRLWNVVYLTVAGSDASTVVTGATLASFIGPLPDPSGNIPMAGLLDPANGTVVPNSAGYNKDQVWVRRPDHLYVVVFGAPVSTGLFAVARVLEYAIDDRETDPRPHYGPPLPAAGVPELSGHVELGGPLGLEPVGA